MKTDLQFLRIGAEALLIVVVIPFVVWLVVSVFTLQSSSGSSDNDIRDIKKIVESTELRIRKIEIDVAVIKTKTGE